MRQIKDLKFRLWHTERKHWIAIGMTIVDFQKDASMSLELPLLTCESGVVVQQFTGLKDVNGVDIYEGDIVEYTQHMFNTDAVRTERKEIKWIEYSAKFNVYETEAGQSDHKVVGNIFEDKNERY